MNYSIKNKGKNMDNYFGKIFERDIENIEMTPIIEVNDYIEEKTENEVFINAINPLFDIGGITHPNKNNGEYYRLDATKKEIYSQQNSFLAHCTSGAQVRFVTDAPEITVRIWLRNAITGMNHFTNRGVYGIDAYVGTGNNRYYVGEKMKTFADSSTYNEGVLNFGSGTKEVLINLPLYGGVSKLTIGFPKNSAVAKPLPRTHKPIAFYGSSITQGGCVSRPGNMYSHILCRALDADCMNMGFSGSAMGEQPVAEYIANRELSAFVMDYDYNSPSAESLAQTHKPFFEIIRKAKPTLPVIFVTHPYFWQATEGDIERKNIVRATYDHAKAKGDKNVYFVDSESFFPSEMRDLYAVDYTHPNDLGQYFMAKAIFPVLKTAIEK